MPDHFDVPYCHGRPMAEVVSNIEARTRQYRCAQCERSQLVVARVIEERRISDADLSRLIDESKKQLGPALRDLALDD